MVQQPFGAPGQHHLYTRAHMARIPFIDPDARPDLAPLVARLRGQRRGSVINVYRTLLHSPGIAETWFDHVNAVRWKTSLDGRLREIIIIRVAYLTESAYAKKQHVPRLAVPEGLSLEECKGLADWQTATTFSARERAALAYTDAVTRDIAVPDAVYAELARHFDPTAIVEITVMIGTYNMHARLVRALDVDLEKD